MKIRRRPSPLLLLLIPSLASVVIGAVPDTTQRELAAAKEPRDAKVPLPTATGPEVLDKTSLGLSPKVDIGNKRCPC